MSPPSIALSIQCPTLESNLKHGWFTTKETIVGFELLGYDLWSEVKKKERALKMGAKPPKALARGPVLIPLPF